MNSDSISSDLTAEQRSFLETISNWEIKRTKKPLLISPLLENKADAERIADQIKGIFQALGQSVPCDFTESQRTPGKWRVIFKRKDFLKALLVINRDIDGQVIKAAESYFNNYNEYNTKITQLPDGNYFVKKMDNNFVQLDQNQEFKPVVECFILTPDELINKALYGKWS